MNDLHIAAASVGLLAASSDMAMATTDKLDTISYRCSDVVVVGTVQNVEDSYKHIEIEDDMLGHGWMTAYIRLKHVLKGSETRPAVHAEYFGHTYLVFPPGKRYLIVLGPTSDGTYTARSFQPWNRKTKANLASACA